MFQFDDNELDFGIYKVLKLKQEEIERFIFGEEGEQGELERIVEDALSEAHRQQAEPFYDFMEQAPEKYAPKVEDVEAHYDELREYVEVASEADEEDRLLNALDAAKEGEDDLETRIYNHILRFFQRYYREGDFGYNDRSLQSYQVEYPDEADYDGSDVLFHWKHKDSYYIKTGQGFHSVAFEIDGERIKYVVEQRADDVAVAQNTNKDDRKHYELDRIEQVEDGQEAGTWRVVFHLAEESTPKAEVFQRLHDTVFGDEVDYETYLFRGERPIFTDLEGDYDEVSGGQKKGASGRQSLRLSPEKYSKRLVKNHRDVFEDLGSNDDKRIAALTEEIEQDTPESLPRRFYTFDKNLNTFYIGQDSDYFIHKHLGRFLSREKDRYVKNVIFSDLEAVLNMQVDNTSVVIARAFDRVASRIIDFLATVEDFQKHLFLLKKKVIDTDYLVSIGKIDEVVDDKDTLRDLVERIVDEPKQRQEWESTFEVEPPADPMQLVINHPTLPVDTAHFDERFKDDLLAQFDDLEAEAEGLLINSENLQALRLLERTYREEVRCIYIDPPYNTGEDTFLYKDRFRHSSWLSMMEDRIGLGRKLNTEDGTIVVSTDDEEMPRLFTLLRQLYGADNELASLVWNRNRKNDATFFSVGHEYMLVFAKSEDMLRSKGIEFEEVKPGIEDAREAFERIKNRNDEWGEIREEWRRYIEERRDPEIRKILSKFKKVSERGPYRDDGNINWPGEGGPRYEVKHPETGKPVKQPKRGWRYSTPERFWEEYEKGNIAFGDDETTVPGRVYYLFESETQVMGSMFWSYAQTASDEFDHIFGDRVFDNPKHFEDIERISRYLTSEDDIVLDYFAGSGTTGHAVLRHNRDEDTTDRKFILVEMGKYFDDVLKERIRRVMYSENWTEGTPDDEVDGTQGLVKYQRLEQYEDILNNLETDLNGDALPDEVPLTYLYRPQEQALRTSLDLSAPFDQTIEYGPQQEESTLDLLETYAYLKGLPVRQRRRYDREGRVYRTLRSDRHLIVFRPIQTGTDDTDVLRDLLEANEGVEVLHVNHDVQRGELEQPRLNLRVVTAEDFDAGTSWT
jgi:adenine-specific DNA-methyltransferase